MSDDKSWMVANHVQWSTDDGIYRTTIYYTDDGTDQLADHPTEWAVLLISDGSQLATGWSKSPHDARLQSAAKLAQLRSASA